MPVRNVGHLMEAMQQDAQPLRVRFTLAAEPDQQFLGTVREVEGATSIGGDHLHMVRVRVDVNESELADLKYVDTTVNAKVVCGKRSLGFVWLRGLWEFIQYRVLFRVA